MKIDRARLVRVIHELEREIRALKMKMRTTPQPWPEAYGWRLDSIYRREATIHYAIAAHARGRLHLRKVTRSHGRLRVPPMSATTMEDQARLIGDRWRIYTGEGSWVAEAIAALNAGRPVTVCPRGGSMRGRIEDGQPVTISPKYLAAPELDDVVLVKLNGNYLLHRIIQIDGERILIGNNIGGINGWATVRDVLGVVTAIEGRPVERRAPCAS